ncbi:hypothetical protein GCM10023169_09100 [Georgenia halophila]|uniref:DUF3618 domain-containing protein n=1 Tax=Georgenia halophila TaxID=620889 RepID=A0ABP8KZR7_9MICO
MSRQSTDNGPGAPQPPKRTIPEIEAQLAKSRLELTNAVDELSDRLDPRMQVEAAKSQLRDLVGLASERAKSFKEDVTSGDPKSIGIVVVGVAAVGVVIAVSLRRR